jgi:hypothetical protein
LSWPARNRSRACWNIPSKIPNAVAAETVIGSSLSSPKLTTLVYLEDTLPVATGFAAWLYDVRLIPIRCSPGKPSLSTTWAA